MNTYYVTFETHEKKHIKSWRITSTELDLDNAKELEEWIYHQSRIEGKEIFLTFWKKLKAS